MRVPQFWCRLVFSCLFKGFIMSVNSLWSWWAATQWPNDRRVIPLPCINYIISVIKKILKTSFCKTQRALPIFITGFLPFIELRPFQCVTIDIFSKGHSQRIKFECLRIVLLSSYRYFRLILAKTETLCLVMIGEHIWKVLIYFL